jgi:hypothetical protein
VNTHIGRIGLAPPSLLSAHLFPLLTPRPSSQPRQTSCRPTVMSRLDHHQGAWKAAIQPRHRSHDVLKPVSRTASAHPVCCAGRRLRSLIADASPVGGRTGIIRPRKMLQTMKPASWRWLAPQRQQRRRPASWRSLAPRRRPPPGPPTGGGTLPLPAASLLRTAGELRWAGQRRGPG